MAVNPLKVFLFLAGGTVAAGATAYVSGALDPYLYDTGGRGGRRSAGAGAVRSCRSQGRAPARRRDAACRTRSRRRWRRRLPPMAADAAGRCGWHAAGRRSQRHDAGSATAGTMAADAAGRFGRAAAGVRCRRRRPPGRSCRASTSCASRPTARSSSPARRRPTRWSNCSTARPCWAAPIAGAEGDFAIVLDEPLKPGDYQITLRATPPGGAAVDLARDGRAVDPRDAGRPGARHGRGAGQGERAADRAAARSAGRDGRLQKPEASPAEPPPAPPGRRRRRRSRTRRRHRRLPSQPSSRRRTAGRSRRRLPAAPADVEGRGRGRRDRRQARSSSPARRARPHRPRLCQRDRARRDQGFRRRALPGRGRARPAGRQLHHPRRRARRRRRQGHRPRGSAVRARAGRRSIAAVAPPADAAAEPRCNRRCGAASRAQPGSAGAAAPCAAEPPAAEPAAPATEAPPA